MEEIIFEKAAIAMVTVNRPKALNALNEAWLKRWPRCCAMCATIRPCGRLL